jgi:hypothetical protein
MAWSWRGALVAVGIGLVGGLYAYAAWAQEPDGRGRHSGVIATISGVIIFMGLTGWASTARRRRWTGVHLAWRPGETAPARVRNRGSAGRGDAVAMTFLLLFSPMFAFIVFVYAVWYEEPATMVLGIAGVGVGVVGVLAMPGLAPRVVVTRRTVSVRNLFVREDVPRRLLAWVTTYPTAGRGASGLGDGEIEFGLTNDARVRFAAGASQFLKGSEYFNRRPAKVRVARRLTRLLDSVPADNVGENSVPTRRRRYGVIVAYVVIAVAGAAGMAVLAAHA